MATKTKTRKAEKAEKAAIVEAHVYSMRGDKVSTIALPDKIFAAPWRSDLVHQVVTAMQANARQNRAHTKDRSEVSGGGRKPWRQKGTGQARHGSTRSPLWRHGGITFGPRKERDYSEKINKKMRLGALFSVLARKAKDGELILVNNFAMTEPKTKSAKETLAALAKGVEREDLVAKKKNAALLALASHKSAVVKSFRNFGNVKTEEARNLNAVDVLAYKYLIIEDPEAAFAALLSRAEAK